MEELHKQVRRARRRLAMQRFLSVLGWCWLATLLVALGLIVAGKIWPPLGLADWIWAAGALVLGLLAAAAWTAATSGCPIHAAMEIDHRFGLKERVSSTLALSAYERQTEAGQALVDDAVRRISRLDVTERFAVSPGRGLLLPLVPAVAAVLVALLISPAVVDNPAVATTEATVKQQVRKSSSDLRRKLEQKRKQAQQKGLKDAERLFKRLDQGTKELADKNEGNRKKALVKLNDLAKEVKKRRQQLGGADKVKQQLNQLKKICQGPADKFAKAVGRGEFKQAIKELEKLKQALAAGKLDQQQEEQLARQLDQMQQKLKDLAEAHEAMKQELEQRVDKLREAGRNDEANKLEEQLDKLREQLPQMQKLDQLADKLGQCSKCLKDGQLEDAGGRLDDVQAGLENLQQQLDELDMLDDAMDQLAQARSQMVCPNCGGAGCKQCQGGMGMGPGRGQGDRPEEETDTAFYQSRVRQKVGKGAASLVDLVDGPNVKGKVEQQIKEQYETARHQSADPLTGQRIPRKHRQHAKEYFDRFREGK